MAKALKLHPMAALFPEMPPEDFAALVEDIKRHGVKVPILVHRGQVLDGRHRYKACQELGVRCPTVEWNGKDPWFELQSLNLVRRHLAREQVYAICRLASQRFPEVAMPMDAARQAARDRKAQGKGQPRGKKALLRSQDRQRESADAIGALVGVSGTTVKRVDRLMREAPELVPKVAAGELSVKKALREVSSRKRAEQANPHSEAAAFLVDPAVQRLEHVVRGEWAKWPREHRAHFIYALQDQLRDLVCEYKTSNGRTANGDDHRPPVDAAAGPVAQLHG